MKGVQEMTGRDKRGRFAPGNQISAGNSGNRSPKWGNTNAVKHGLFRIKLNLYKVDPDGWLHLIMIRGESINIRIHPDKFTKDGEGIRLHNDVVDGLEKLGYYV
jgi:hypothetical protein